MIRKEFPLPIQLSDLYKINFRIKDNFLVLTEYADPGARVITVKELYKNKQSINVII